MVNIIVNIGDDRKLKYSGILSLSNSKGKKSNKKL